MNKKIVIVGGVAGGATAAARLRRIDETSKIVLFEKGEYISFANCGLPYYIGETIKDRQKLLVQTVEGMSKKFDLDIRNLSEVIGINREAKTVQVKDHKTGNTYDESYDDLVLSPRARPIVPPIPGLNEAKAISFESNGKIVVTNNGKRMETDLIILSIGVRPENELAINAGLHVGERGGIQVNDYLQTNDPNIYAIGDAIEVKDYINGKPTMIPLAWPANRQGRLVADNIYGKKAKYGGTLGTSIAKVLDFTVAITGNNEKTLKRLGIPYGVIHLHPSSHAGYYPGAAPIALKLVFDKETGKIFGAQAVGNDGVDKRMDVIATAIKGGLSVLDLADLELAYAPPYSSAKDPVNMLGYVATNIVEGVIETVQWHEIDEIVANGATLVDVRTPIELEMGFIEGSINIPIDDIRERLTELPKNETIYVNCQVGLRGYLASRILQENGFKVKNLYGGWKTYSSVHGTKKKDCDVKTDDSVVARVDCNEFRADVKIDASGLQCPGPIMSVAKVVKEMAKGQILEVTATDSQLVRGLPSWCEHNGHTLLEEKKDRKMIKAYVQKN